MCAASSTHNVLVRVITHRPEYTVRRALRNGPWPCRRTIDANNRLRPSSTLSGSKAVGGSLSKYSSNEFKSELGAMSNCESKGAVAIVMPFTDPLLRSDIKLFNWLRLANLAWNAFPTRNYNSSGTRREETMPDDDGCAGQQLSIHRRADPEYLKISACPDRTLRNLPQRSSCPSRLRGGILRLGSVT